LLKRKKIKHLKQMKMKLLVQEPDRLKTSLGRNKSRKKFIVAARKSSRLKTKIKFFYNFIQFIFTFVRIFVCLYVFLGKIKSFKRTYLKIFFYVDPLDPAHLDVDLFYIWICFWIFFIHFFF